MVIVQVGAVKIYVAAVEALRKSETQDETQFTSKFDPFPIYFLARGNLPVPTQFRKSKYP
jgi:hypothetical protein